MTKSPRPLAPESDEAEGRRIKEAGAAATFGRKATMTPSRRPSARQL